MTRGNPSSSRWIGLSSLLQCVSIVGAFRSSPRWLCSRSSSRVRLANYDDTEYDSPTSSDAVPSTPCVRICRYNKNFYDGQVCIGCFRDAFDIGEWVSFDNTERLYALEDALDRWDGESFEGSISRQALEEQVTNYKSKVGH